MSPPGTYFATFTTWQRRRLFVVESYARLFLKTLYGYKRQGRFQLHEFVVMPEHVHLILTPAMDIALERAMQLIKGGYSHAVGVEFKRKDEVWQRGFTDHRIRDPEDFAGHRNYIHQNPVERNCSAFPGFRVDAWPPVAKAA
jgi:putative transposase